MSLHTRVLGHGSQVILLLHGGPGLSLQEMTPYDALMTAGRRLVSFDQPGAGATGRPTGMGLTLSSQVADIEAIRRSTEAERIWLVGQSWGGLVAGAYAAAHPDRVAGLALIDAAPPDLQAFISGQTAFRHRLEQLQHQGLIPARLPGPVSGSCLPELTAELPAYAADPKHPPRQPQGVTCTAATAPVVFAAAIRADVLSRVAQGLAAFHGHVLVLTGAEDAFGPAWPAAWRTVLPQASVISVPDAGHAPVLERPAAVLEAVNRLLLQR